MEECKIEPQEHWDNHQGLWHMLGCKMEIKNINKQRVKYVDRNTNIQYTYWTSGRLDRRKL